MENGVMVAKITKSQGKLLRVWGEHEMFHPGLTKQLWRFLNSPSTDATQYEKLISGIQKLNPDSDELTRR
jgi:hypothetical protein